MKQLLKPKLLSPLETTILICFAAILLASGCGQPGKPATSIRKIDSGQFEVLQQAQRKVNAFISAGEGAVINRDQNVQAKLARLTEVIKKFEASLPRPVRGASSKEQGSDLTSKLMGFDSIVRWKDSKGRPQEDRPSAWYVASDYLNAVDTIYGLYDFEKYVAEHTLNDGTVSNPANPAALMVPSGGLQMYGAGASLHGLFMVGITRDPATGTLRYVFSAGLKGQDAPTGLNEVESKVIDEAHSWVAEGDELLVERTSI